MSSLTRRFVVLASFAALIAPGVGVAATSSGAAAAPNFCTDGSSYSGTTITWTGQAGKAHSHDWNDPDNWDPATVPDADQTPATYQSEYVCIGDDHSGSPATVAISGSESYHLAGIDIERGAQLTIEPGGGLFLGAADSSDLVPSYVEKLGELQLDAGTLGGNATMTVAGTMDWSGHLAGSHKLVATQTSSECVFDPSISACPGDTSPGGGRTVIAASGKLLVDGSGFGGVALTDQRVIDNSGAIKLSNVGYVVMDNGTKLIDERGSTLDLAGKGGFYQGAKAGHSALASLHQKGAVTKEGSGTSVVGVPVTFASKVTPVVTGGIVSFDASATPIGKASRGVSYGLGGCQEAKNQLCRDPIATGNDPQDAIVGTSTAGPKVSKIAVSLASGPSKIHGKSVIGKSVDVTAPNIKTTHSTHLTFKYDATTKGVHTGLKPVVFRGKHRITLCKVHGLTAENTSCIISAKVAHSGGAASKGDLTIIVITIQPKARWSVA